VATAAEREKGGGEKGKGRFPRRFSRLSPPCLPRGKALLPRFFSPIGTRGLIRVEEEKEEKGNIAESASRPYCRYDIAHPPVFCWSRGRGEEKKKGRRLVRVESGLKIASSRASFFIFSVSSLLICHYKLGHDRKRPMGEEKGGEKGKGLSEKKVF